MWEPICILCFSDFERGQRNDKPLTSLASPRFEMHSLLFVSSSRRELARADRRHNWLKDALRRPSEVFVGGSVYGARAP